MTAGNEISKEPLWIAMEKRILEHASGGSSASDLESAIKKIASELDQSGYSVSNHAGNLLQLRWAMEEKNRNGKALMQDLNTAIKKLTFDDVENAKAATARIISALGATWPKLQDSERKPAILDMVEDVRLGFLVQRAKERSEGGGIRYLIDSEIAADVILESLGITQERYAQEVAAIKAEEAKKEKVRSLLEAVADKPEEERIKHLINHEITDELILEIAKVELGSIESVRKSMEEELKDQFLELRTIDLLALDRDIPYTDMEFTCSPKTWQIKDIENTLKYLLYINLPRISVDRTNYEPIPKQYPYEQNHYVWPITEEKYGDTHVSFSYDESWPFELYIRPNQGKTLRSNANRGQGLLNVLCLQLWHFTYDVRYPVLVTLKDDATRTHEDYTFNFGFDVSINHNMPDKSNFASSTFSFDTTASEDDYCSGAKANILTVHTFENVSTKEAGDLITEIDDVDISFTCVNMRCPVGESEWQFRGAVSYVSKEVPYCVNGVLRGEKEGYEEVEMFVTTDKEKSVDLYLRPTVEIPISIIKHYEMSPSVEEEFEEEDSAYITLEADDFGSEGAFSYNSTGTLKLLANWNYEYNLTIYLMDESTIRGGYQIIWTPDWNKLRSAKEIIFHVLERPYSEDPEKLAEMITKMDELSLRYSIPDPEIITVIRPR